jgi:hypothetical protein
MLRSQARCRDLHKWLKAGSPWMRPAGYSRDESEDTSTARAVTHVVAWTSEKSGRPGSNWHHQLGRLRFYH